MAAIFQSSISRCGVVTSSGKLSTQSYIRSECSGSILSVQNLEVKARNGALRRKKAVQGLRSGDAPKLGVAFRSSARIVRVKAAANDAQKAEELLKSAAQKLLVKAENLKSQATLAREQLLQTAGKTKEDLAQQAGLTAEQLRLQTDKTATQLKEEAEKATEELKIQAEKAAQLFAASAHETAEKAKEELAKVSESAPEPVKEIAATAIEAHTPEKAKSGAVIHDFCLGIPYGGLLVFGGLLWFLLVGSLHALRFGVLLGGALLATSVQSLRVWQQGRRTNGYIAAQAAISLILAVKEAMRYTETGQVFPTLITSIASALMFGFYTYVVSAGGPPKKKTKYATS